MTDNILLPLRFVMFRASVDMLVRSNEITSCFNPWVITPSVFPDEVEPVLIVSPIITAVVYAVIEPVAVKHLQSLTAPPWSSVMGHSSNHLLWSLMNMIGYTTLCGIPKSSKQSSTSDNVTTLSLQRLRWHRFYVIFVIMQATVSSAVVNSALLVFSQSLHVPSLLQQPSVLFLTPLALLVSVGCRFADYTICRKTRRGRSLCQALIYQAVLFCIRACTRAMIGIPPFMLFEKLDPTAAERMYGSDRYAWVYEGQKGVAFKVEMILTLCPIPLVLVGYYLTLKGLGDRDRRAKCLNVLESSTQTCGGSKCEKNHMDSEKS
jgi:hypothetical protein